jgi:DNA-binding XRE family transcriptional regulator
MLVISNIVSEICLRLKIAPNGLLWLIGPFPGGFMPNSYPQLPSAAMIRAARSLLAINQARLAVLAGVTVKTISLIENAAEEGRVDGRRRKIVERIRQRLEDDFAIEFLFTNERTGVGVRIGRAD